VNQVEINKKIEELINSKSKFTDDELSFIDQYEGSGGQGGKGAKGEGLLYEFFTPDYVVDLMWELARFHGYNDMGSVLEPSIGTGRMIKPAKDKRKVVGFEINPVTARITEILYPGITVYNGYFETAFLEPDRFRSKLKKSLTWLNKYPFSLVIGNPPYGIYQNTYSGYFDKKLFKQIEIFFIYQGLQLLQKGGLLVYVISSNFLRNGDKYSYAKEKIGEIATLVDAYRLPSVFKYSEVPTDIIILKKK
jgi:type I restriction-modification system DNA methylase subunit